VAVHRKLSAIWLRDYLLLWEAPCSSIPPKIGADLLGVSIELEIIPPVVLFAISQNGDAVGPIDSACAGILRAPAARSNRLDRDVRLVRVRTGKVWECEEDCSSWFEDLSQFLMRMRTSERRICCGVMPLRPVSAFFKSRMRSQRT
jgi:hypothetical protein